MSYLHSEEKEHLLGTAVVGITHTNTALKRSIWTLCTFTFLSVTLNLIQFATSSEPLHTVPDDESAYGLHSPNKTVAWDQHSVYSSGNASMADDAWDAIDIDSGIVAVDKAWALEKGLPLGSTFPWDNNKALYLVNAYHGLHCLKNLYWAFMDYRDGREPSIAPHHIAHCLDQLRSDVLCAADDTLRVTTPDIHPSTAEGQGRKCRSWDALEQWTLDHPGCFRYGNPTVEDEKADQIPRMRYCPEGSQELENVRTYFNMGADWKPTEEPLWRWSDMHQ